MHVGGKFIRFGKEDSNSNLQKLRTDAEIRKDLKNQYDVKCELEETKTLLKPNKNLVSPNLNLKEWKHDCNQLLNEMVALPISEPLREPVSKIDFPNYYRLFFDYLNRLFLLSRHYNPRLVYFEPTF